MLIAHAGTPPMPHDVWSGWHVDVPLIVVVAVVVALYVRGRRRARAADVWFGLAIASLVVALSWPLEAMARALLSAHMAQHLLLIVVAAPLLVLSDAWRTLERGVPRTIQTKIAVARARLGIARLGPTVLAVPLAVAALHVITLWVWHSPRLYEAALRSGAIHVIEHATLLGTALLFWATVIGVRSARRVEPGARVLLLFAVSMQSVILSLLMIFAAAPWYATYAASARAWGIGALSDQQLAGALMWVPAGVVYLVAALAAVARWISETERRNEPANVLGRSAT